MKTNRFVLLSALLAIWFATPAFAADKDGKTTCAEGLGEFAARQRYKMVRAAEAQNSYFQTRDWPEDAGVMVFPGNRLVGYYDHHFFDAVVPVKIEGRGPSMTFAWLLPEPGLIVRLMPEFHTAHDPARDLFGEVRKLGTDQCLAELFFLRNPKMVDPRVAAGTLAANIREWIKAGQLDFASHLSQRLAREVAALPPQALDLDED